MTDDILIGTELANDLGVDVGRQDQRIRRRTGASRVLTITGIFDLGNKGANERNDLCRAENGAGAGRIWSAA